MRGKPTLWTKNYTLIIVATVMGAIGGVAVNFALSFLVFDETQSTFAAGFLLAAEMVPQVLVPLVASPWLDRLPRKPFLVGGDVLNGVLYLTAGFYLLRCNFSYGVYLTFALILSSLGAFDSLAYNSLYPKLIPEGFSQKGYTVSGMVYPTIMVIMTPVAAVLYEKTGVAVILLGQGVLSLLAAAVESRIDLVEKRDLAGGKFSFSLWFQDLKDAMAFLKKEKGLQSVYSYVAYSNGLAAGYSSVLIAFFRTAPGFSVAMYSAFSVAEVLGRTIGGLFHYNVKIPKEKRFSLAYFVYLTYDLMDMILLWIPYAGMLVNRAVCGFLGINSGTLRESSVQDYIPDKMRAKLNAFSGIYCSILYAVGSLVIGALGEVLDYRVCLSLCGLTGGILCWIVIWRRRREVRYIYNREFEVPDAMENT